MTHRLPVAAVLLLIASAFGFAQRAQPAQRTLPDVADAIYYNGKIVTVDVRSQVAEAFAVRGDRFVAVGTNADVRALAGRGTRIVDLHGRTVVPGLIDNHNHQYHVALLTLRGVDMKDVPSLGEMLARLRRAAVAAKPGETIFTTTGWSPEAFPEKRAPTRQELDTIASDRPIVVYASRGRVHVNTAALKALGITRDTPLVNGVTVGRDTTGELDAVLNGSPAAVLNLTARIVPPPTLDEKKSIIAKIQAQQHAMGLTGIRELQIQPEVMRAYYELWRDHALTLRTSVGLELNAGDEAKLEPMLDAWGVGPGFGDEWLRIDGIAEYNPGEQVREPYVDRDGKDVGSCGCRKSELARPSSR